MRSDKPNLIVDLTLAFSVKIIEFTELLESKGKRVIANQLLKSGTSIGANTYEAQNSESKRDFIHKFKIAAKEADETMYWLKLCEMAPSYPFDETIKTDLVSISKIISKIISSSKDP
ncbi:four helix bundle protein [Roseivirga echinicomitans]|uniref:Four helix bundle protein n=1 Tax=Roseivirga echinicomitans TaxID=296218 RepID=A0A150X358_9BACT|nr:four helix bundle protein [Roseivirga echinicomitans]KYG73144.1 four helix bundle protein [Roseivirga echinicomitans]